MGRKLDITWNHSADELYALYRNATDLDARRRYQALWLLRRDKDVQETAEETGVSYRTIQRWKNWYNEGGLEKLLENSHGGKRDIPKRLSWDDRVRLIEEISKGRFSSFGEIRDWIRENFDVEYTESGIRSMYYRLRAGITEGGPLKRAAREFLGLEKDPAERRAERKRGKKDNPEN